MKRIRSILSLGALVVLAVLCTAGVKHERLVRQQGVSANPDSAIGGVADTATAFTLEKKLTDFVLTVAAVDTSVIYVVQVSPDGSNWFTIDTDTTAATGGIESTADFADSYAIGGWQCRVITTASDTLSFARTVRKEVY